MDDFRKGAAKGRADRAPDDSAKGWFGRLSGWKKIGVVVGGVFGFLLVLGLLFGEEEQTSNDSTITGQEVVERVEKPQDKPEASLTPGQENAIRAAEDYLDYGPFSKAGLISQLSSSAGEGFPEADARFAVNNIEVDWNEQAYRAAKDYLDYSAFSLEGLIQQLSSSAGEQFTDAQARYGANKAYNEG